MPLGGGFYLKCLAVLQSAHVYNRGWPPLGIEPPTLAAISCLLAYTHTHSGNVGCSREVGHLTSCFLCF